MRWQIGARSWRDHAFIFGPALLLCLIAVALLVYVPDPAPPRHLVMATGSPSGAYHRFGLRYREIAARDGIDLELRPTAGSVENLKLLASREADIAFVQGGTAKASGVSQEGLSALASVYLEPVWIFHRGGIESVRDLRGKRVAVGTAGSGSRAVASVLLADNGMAEEVSLVGLGGEEAARALRAGAVDAALIVASASTSVVRALAARDDVELLSLRRAPAYATRHIYLSALTLHEGVLDLRKNVPPESLSMVAPAANLAARRDLHPAIVSLLLNAAKELHSQGDLLTQAGTFPARTYLELPLHEYAASWHESGPSFLHRYLPFWAATLANRLLLLLLPLAALLIPLLRLMLPTYRWRVRSRIYRWYRQIRAVEQAVAESDVQDRLRELRVELDRIEDDARKTKVPLAYMDELYNLRLHIQLVREALREKLP